MKDDDMFNDLIGCEVKVPYRDGPQFKIARGVLQDVSSGFIKITGKLGTIVINQKNVERISKVNNTPVNSNTSVNNTPELGRV